MLFFFLIVFPPLSGRPLRAFQEILRTQAKMFYSEDMRIDAHYVHKTDLTGHLTDGDIQESFTLLTLFFQKRKRRRRI